MSPAHPEIPPLNLTAASSPLNEVSVTDSDRASDTEPARVPEPHRAHIWEDDQVIGRDDTDSGMNNGSHAMAPSGCGTERVSHDVPNDRTHSDPNTEPHHDPVADATMAKILSSNSRSVQKSDSFLKDDAYQSETPRKSNSSDGRSVRWSETVGTNPEDLADPEAGNVEATAHTPEKTAKTCQTPDHQLSGGFSRRLKRMATRAFFPSSSVSDGMSKQSDEDGKRPIRLRRTSSYYVYSHGDGNTRGSYHRALSFASPCGAFDKSEKENCADDSVREQRARKRREELASFRRRVADSGKLIASTMAGLFAGIVLWAMTTVTAQLTALKFDYTKKLLTSGDLGDARNDYNSTGYNSTNNGTEANYNTDAGTTGTPTTNLLAAWAFYSGCACLAIGVTAFFVLHPNGAPMSRGSGIPELKGYLNGNRQQGLFHWRTFLGRSVGICLVITATMPFGREGPSVHIGACAASAVLNLVPWRKKLGWQPSPEERRQILQLGSAAGVAAAFNAPIGALLYVMEEVASSLPHDYVWRAMLAAGTAVGSAQILYAVNEGRVDYSSLVITDPDSSTGWSPSDLPLIIVLAVLAGAFSAVFTLTAAFFGSVRRGGGGKNYVDVPEQSTSSSIFQTIRRFNRYVSGLYHSKLGAWCDAVLGALLVATAQVALPALFPCRPAPEIMENGSSYNRRRLLDEDLGFGDIMSGEQVVSLSDESIYSNHPGRSLLSSAVYIPRTFVQYTCSAGDFNEMATLMLQNEEGVVKHLFARDDMYSEALFTPSTVFAFLAYFFIAASITFGGAFPAGVFIPNMLMGAATGRLFGSLAAYVNPNAAPKGTYALIGSAAMLSGFTRMTAAVVVIIIEATASLDVLAPIILACVISRAVATCLIGASLDERLIVAKGVPFLEHDPHPNTGHVKIAVALTDSEKIRGPVIAFRPHERLSVLLNALLLTDHNAFPVLEDVQKSEKIVGLVTRAMLQRVLRVVLEETDDDDENSSMVGANSVSDSSVRVKINDESNMDKGVLLENSVTHKAHHTASTISRTSSSRAIDEWSVENFHVSDTGSVGTDEDKHFSDKHTGSTDDDAHCERSAQREGNAFLDVVARWVNVKQKVTEDKGFTTSGVTNLCGIKGPYQKESHISRKVLSTALDADAVPSHARAGDENHFDELKEGLVREIKNGHLQIRDFQKRRMVDLTHAVDKAPWCVDGNTRLGRVHALFARLGVRHLCVTTDWGNKLEGIITRHDLIRVHREAEGHGKRE